MKTVAIIQARMGSSRLPGKMLIHLGRNEALTHVINRVKQAKKIDEVVVATSEKKQDLVIVEKARKLGVSVYCGDELNVLGRMYNAAVEANAELIVRIAGDCVFISPEVIDHMLEEMNSGEIDYLTNKLDRTFPLGLDVEVFTKRSFDKVAANATEPHEREHVTPYYLENLSKFSVQNVTAAEVFEQDHYQGRTDIELVLDEAADYFYLNEIYSSLPKKSQDIRSVIDYIDETDLTSKIADVSRKTKDDIEQNHINK